MDFTTINLIAYSRYHQELLDETATDREPVLRQLGRLFVTIGEKMVQAANQPAEGYPSLENEACV
jgi:hypothetical protein